jgi:hypothetical protein
LHFDFTVNVLIGRRLRRRYANHQEFNTIKSAAALAVTGRSHWLGYNEATQEGSDVRAVAASHAATFIEITRYFGGPTQTATSGVLEADAAGPQDAPFSPRNWA